MNEHRNERRVVGPPGCGKTTWLGEKVDEIVERGEKPFIASMTKAAAAEIGSRKLPVSYDALGTLHSHCYHALGQPEIAEGREHLEDWNERYPQYKLSPGSGSTADRVDGDNLEPSASTDGDRLMNEYQLHRARMTAPERMSPNLREFVQKWQEWKDVNGLMDFTDLIETALRDVDHAPGYPDAMLVDEAQDLDLLEMSLVRKWGAHCRSLYVVGDPDQAIYTWRGADPRAFTAVEIPQENRQVLSQSYRVPAAVHARALRWINEAPGRERVEYHPRDYQGEVRNIDATWKDPEKIVEDAVKYLERDLNVMFLATCSYMLTELIRVLRSEGVPFWNPYRRRNGAWNPLQRRRGVISASDRVASFLHLNERGYWNSEHLNRWTDMVKAREALRNGNRKAVRALDDQDNGGMRLGEFLDVINDPEVMRRHESFTLWGRFVGVINEANASNEKLSRELGRITGLDRLLEAVGDAVLNSGVSPQGWDRIRTVTAEESMRVRARDGLHPEEIRNLLTDEAEEAGISGDLDWLQNNLTADKRSGAAFPIAVARKRGLEELERPPRAVIGTAHSTKGGEADVVYVFPDLSRAGMAEWTGNAESRASVYRLFYVAMTRARDTLVLPEPAGEYAVNLE